MKVELDSEIVERLSSRAVLAYVAASIAIHSEVTTAYLAGLVKASTSTMLEGLKELTVAAPEVVSKAPKNKWRCGAVVVGGGQVFNQDSSTERFRLFVDDLKRYWDYLNPTISFNMSGKDGFQIRSYLADHPERTQTDWRQAFNHRKTSIVKHGNASRTEPHWAWISRLDLYLAGPLDKFGRPVSENDRDGRAGKIAEGNRKAGDAFLRTFHN